MCWHRWDIFKDIRLTEKQVYHIVKTTKICRKCGETKVKEKITW